MNSERLQGIIIEIVKGNVMLDGEPIGKTITAESLEDLISKGRAEISSLISQGYPKDSNWGLRYK